MHVRRQHVFALGKRIEISIVLKILLGHIAIECPATSLIGEKQIFGQSVAFVPGIRLVFVGAAALFRPRQRFFGK